MTSKRPLVSRRPVRNFKRCESENSRFFEMLFERSYDIQEFPILGDRMKNKILY